MKQSFTYSGDPKTRREAMREAKKVGVKNFSELVEGLLKSYKEVKTWREKAEKWDNLDDEIGLVYIGQQESTLEDVGRFIVDKFGY